MSNKTRDEHAQATETLISEIGEVARRINNVKLALSGHETEQAFHRREATNCTNELNTLNKQLDVMIDKLRNGGNE